ncbi:hypothetical protein ACIGHB_29820 [Streptomyces sp. NPDC085460]|uniref:hypothetical protein n=1 Tax=Streptomyces sp. NPDC085460 TaxID=3365723 RepID=UPI0037CF2763
MNTNPWADAFEAAARAALADPDLFRTGRDDLNSHGIQRLRIEPGRISGFVATRGAHTELHATITLPLLTSSPPPAPACAQHHDSAGDALPDCLTDPAHAHGPALLPDPAQLRLTCTCSMATCRHTAVLAHAFADHLRTHPEDLAAVRGLRAPSRPLQDVPGTNESARPKPLVSAHHAWSQYRKTDDLPPVPTLLAEPTSESIAHQDRALPPPPAPRAEYLLALIEDAAAQARHFLTGDASLECAWEEDAVRLAARVPHLRVPELAERLGLDVADLRRRIAAESLRA